MVGTGGLTLLKGGLSNSFADAKKRFLKVKVTKSRLKGMVGLYFDWEIDKTLCPWAEGNRYRMYFLLDYNTLLDDNYVGVSYENPNGIEHIDNSIIGGIYGDFERIGYEDAVFLLQHYESLLKRKGKSIAGNPEYDFLLEKEINLSEEEKEQVLYDNREKMTSPYLVINYFLDRAFIGDGDGADVISERNDLWREIALKSGDDLRKNIIQKTDLDNKYMCTSILEGNNVYYLCVSNIYVKEAGDEYIVDDARVASVNKISVEEATMQLERYEHIGILEIYQTWRFKEIFQSMFPKCIVREYPAGTMYIQYNEKNSYMDEKIYYHEDEISKFFFITEANELILVTKTESMFEEGIDQIMDKKVVCYTGHLKGYTFEDPIFTEYLESDYDSIVDFIEEYYSDQDI